MLFILVMCDYTQVTEKWNACHFYTDVTSFQVPASSGPTHEMQQ